MTDRRAAGDFQAMISWSVETWGGHPDLSFFLDSWHSEFVAKPGQTQPPRNWQRWSKPELDKIIEAIRTIDFDDPKGIELGLDYLKLAVREMPTIPLMSYNVFTVMDETYWTGYPERRRGAVHRSGAELGQHALHDGEAEAEIADRPRVISYLGYLLRRLGQFVLVVFIGINISFFITHATPIDPVEQTIAAGDQLRQHQPGGDRANAPVAARALRHCRVAWLQQYAAFWRRVPSAISVRRCRRFPRRSRC